MGKTIDMYIFKNPKFEKEINKLITEVSQTSAHELHLEFNCKDPNVGYISIWAYLDVDVAEIEEELFRIYQDFFSNDVAYVNSEDELEGGYQNLFYYDNERHYFATMDNIAYDIRKMFRNYNELKRVESRDLKK